MKNFTYAYATGTFHINGKVNVLSVRDLARSSNIILWFKKWRWIKMNNGVKWHNLKHRSLN